MSKKLEKRIDDLERKIRELEARPPMVIYPPVIMPTPRMPSPYLPPQIPYYPQPWWEPPFIVTCGDTVPLGCSSVTIS